MNIQYNKLPGPLTAVTVAVLTALAAPSYAQTPQADPTESPRAFLEELIVTAQKRAQTANSVPIAISAFSGDDLGKLGVNDTRDLSALVPGFTTAASSANTPIYTIRGVGFNTPNVSSASPVGIYYDEAAYAYPYMGKGLAMDINRVEVLKGPQGTLFGRNTTGGLINFVTNKPTDEFEAGVKATIGSYDSYGTEVFLSGAISDKVRGRVVARTEQRDKGWQKSVSRDDTNGEVDRTALRAILEASLTDTFKATLTANYWQDKSDTQAGQATAFTPEAAVTLAGVEESIIVNPTARDADWVSPNEPSFIWPGTTFDNPRPEIAGDSSQTALSLRLEKEFGDTLTVTSLTNYIDVERDDVTDRDATQFELVVFRDLGEIQSFSQELRLTGSNEDDSLNFVTGIYYSKDELTDTSQVWAAGTASLLSLREDVAAASGAFFGATPAQVEEIRGGSRHFQNSGVTDAESISIFGQVDYLLTNELTLTAGLRYTEDDKDFIGCSSDIPGSINHQTLFSALPPLLFGVPFSERGPGDCVTFNTERTDFVSAEGVKNNLNEDSLSGRLALAWQMNSDTLYYGSISRGFKAGAFPTLSASGEEQLAPAVQEELLAFEVGTKLTLSESVQLNAAAYYYDYTDKQVFGQVQDPVFFTLTRLVNVPESEVVGAEFDLTWFAADMTVMKFAGSYMKTEIKEFTGISKLGVETDFAGAEFEYSPEFQANALIAQGFMVNNNLEAWITLDMQYSSDQQADFEGDSTFAVDSYTVVGLRAGIESTDGVWSAAVFGRNITDEYYWNSVQNQTDTAFRYAAMPITWGAEFAYNF